MLVGKREQAEQAIDHRHLAKPAGKNIGENRHAVDEIELLENHADVAAKLADFGGNLPAGLNALAVDLDIADAGGIGDDKAGDMADQG